MKNKKNIIIISSIALFLIVISIGIGAYFYLSNNSANNKVGSSFQNGGASGSRQQFTPVSGTVSSITDKVAIVDIDNNGGQKVVTLSDTSTIIKSQAATQTDVFVVGNNVIVTGQKNADGSIAADSVTLQMSQQRPTDGSAQTTPKQGNGGNRIRPSGTINGMGGFGQIYGANSFLGKITAVNDTSITIQQGGQSQTTYTINTTPTTKLLKQVTGSVADVVANVKIVAVGIVDSTGGITARNVTIL